MLNKLQMLVEKSKSLYYNFPVSVILECSDGTLFEGVNIETSSPASGICAERNALFSAITKGYTKKDFKRIHIYNKSGKIITPCFICRQALIDYCNEDLEIISYTDTDSRTYLLKDLCQESFSSADLD